ncbi:U-box domain-containing protein 40 [Jatropha curcas]|uniref:U-box domain-containing protein 40 n=1 Tax=Jatropha curcas TaxID=180498 RepID=UPI0009D660A8|nr:U-box domain-containing protein 40 [Jatropha curcas]
MEFQEALMRLVIHKHPVEKRLVIDDSQKETEKQKWRVASFRRSSSSKKQHPKQEVPVPKEFLCPISGSLMNDPVIVSSGHTFDRVFVQACNTLSFTPTLVDEKLVRAKMEDKDLICRVKEIPPVNFNHAVTELTHSRRTNFSSSSEESVETAVSTPPLQFTTRPSCYSSASSSSETEALNPNPNHEEEEIFKKLKSSQVFEIEEALISLRKITRTNEHSRIELCTPRLLSAVRSLINSRYINIQVNSVACLVNLSLQKVNKVKIVRSGIVPLLIDVLKGGFPEAQEHACGVIFSLALDDHNKTAIGVLGALPPLLHLLRSESEWTRHDSALALYHLSLVQSNRSKLVKLGAVPILLGLVKSGHMRSRILLILCNLASCVDGRAAMLDSGGVDCLVGLLKGSGLESESTRESCVSVLYALSHGGLRFKGLAKTAGAMEVLLQLEKSGREQTREKAKRMLEKMKGKVEEEGEEEVDWEELLLDSGSIARSRSQLGGGNESSIESSEL